MQIVAFLILVLSALISDYFCLGTWMTIAVLLSLIGLTSVVTYWVKK